MNNNGNFVVTHEMILRELYKIAFANMGNYYDDNAVLKPINQLSDDDKAAISQYQLIDCIGDYQERAGEISKIKLHNKLSALDKIARHVGFYRSMEDGKGKMENVRKKTESTEVSLETLETKEDGLGAEVVTDCSEHTPLRSDSCKWQETGCVEKMLTIAPFLKKTQEVRRPEEESIEKYLTIAPFLEMTGVNAASSIYLT
jgi:hypothetical protein